MNLCLDTSAYIWVARGKAAPALLYSIQTADVIIIPLFVMAELRLGFLEAVRGSDEEATFRTFLAAPSVKVAYPDEITTRFYAEFHYYLRRKGTPIPVNDIWIAAQAVQASAVLATFDAHFEQLPQVTLWKS